MAHVAGGFDEPRAMLVDGDGVLVAGRHDHQVVRLNADGSRSVVVGTGTKGFAGDDGSPATQALLAEPTDLERTEDGYLIADQFNQRVREVVNGRITTVAGGAGGPGFAGDGGAATSARLGRARGISVRPDGSFLIADEINHRIREVDARGIIDTVAGTGVAGSSGDRGPAIAAALHTPLSVKATSDDGYLIAERGPESGRPEGDGYRIRKVSAGGIITTVAGTGAKGSDGDGGPATDARINLPRDIAPTADGGFYLSDSASHRVRRVAPDGTITTVAGTGTSASTGDGGSAIDATFGDVYGIELTPDGGLYVADTENDRVRFVASPLPRVTGVTASAAAGQPISVTGSGFPTTAVVLWNGAVLPTTRVSSTRLDAQVPPGAAGTAQVSARAAAAGGDVSGALPVAVVGAPPAATPAAPALPVARPRPPVSRPRSPVVRPQLGLPRLRALNRPRAGGVLRLSATSSLAGNGARLALQQRRGARWVQLRATALRGRTLPLRVRVPRAGRLVLRTQLRVGARARASRPLTVRVLPRPVAKPTPKAASAQR